MTTIKNLALLSALFFLCSPAHAVLEKRPKLIVTIVIDQFRADYLPRFEKRFLPAKQSGGDVGGFEYLMTNGAYFPFATYDILQSMTGPGHATVLSGSFPYLNGIPMNDWYDSDSHEVAYCTQDRAEAIVGPGSPNPEGGASPKNFIGTTVGDEIKNAGYPSRVVSVSLKERAAILMGGHRADLALWFDAGTHQWVSSRYYLPAGKLPAWVDELNGSVKKHEGTTINWDLSTAQDKEHMPTGYSATNAFPHSAPFGSGASFAMPLGLELTEEAAEKAFDAFELGTGKATDLFAVSFSSHDYAGHAFGPQSREMEEMTVQDDLLVAKLLNHIRKHVPEGLKDVIVVLTGDHGAPPAPDWAKEQRLKAGKISEKDLVTVLSTWLDEKFGKLAAGEKWVPYVHDFNFFLNRAEIARKRLTLSKVEAVAKEALARTPGIAYVFSGTDYAERKLPPGMHERTILKTYYPGRSGDLILIPQPFFMPGPDPVTHLTAYSYDRSVPLILAGFHLKAGIYSTPAQVVDIAPTLSFLSAVLPPALSEGRVLSEAIEPSTP